MAVSSSRSHGKSAVGPAGGSSDDGFVVGIDENGLGPLLGPLLVTAVAARVTPAGRAFLAQAPTGSLSQRLGDSKGLVAHGDIALAEAWARATVERMGASATTPDAVLSTLSSQSREELWSPCPSASARLQCWGTEGETWEGETWEGESREADAPLVDAVRRDLDELASRGVDITRGLQVTVCTKRLNEAQARGHSRFDVDLHSMESLLLAIRQEGDRDIEAVCGKVGGYARYGAAFGPLSGRLHSVIEEGPARSSYAFPGLGTVSFVQDADAGHLLVGLASLIGKWARELLMGRIVRAYRDFPAFTGTASGYHDPVTRRFVAATAQARADRQIPDTCFARAKATSDKPQPKTPRRPPKSSNEP